MLLFFVAGCCCRRAASKFDGTPLATLAKAGRVRTDLLELCCKESESPLWRLGTRRDLRGLPANVAADLEERGEVVAQSVGWYPDQNDPRVEVYWDGTRWHGRRWRAEGSPPAPVAATASVFDGVRNWWNALSRNAQLGIAGAMVAVLILALVIVVASKPWESAEYKNCKETADANGLTGRAAEIFIRGCTDTYTQLSR